MWNWFVAVNVYIRKKCSHVPSCFWPVIDNITEKKNNEWVLIKINCKERLLTSINSRKMGFAGHVLRKQNIEK